MFAAICDRCSQHYHVPDADMRYRCAACGEGIVSALPSPPEGEPLEAAEEGGEPGPADEATDRTCPSCGAENMPDANFCEACGTSLRLPEGVVVSPAGGKLRLGRKLARFELEGIQRSLSLVRKLYGLGLFFSTILLFGLLAIQSDAGRHELRGLEYDELREMMAILLVLAGIMIAIDLGGVLFLRRRPMFWSVLFACVHSLALIMNLMGGELLPILIQAIFAIVGWKAVGRVARLRPLLEEYPDLLRSRAVRG